MTSKYYIEASKYLLYFGYLNDVAVRNPHFAHYPLPPVEYLIRPTDPYAVYIGRVEGTNWLFYWSPSLVKNPIMTVLGVPGAGKSEFVKTLTYRYKAEKHAKFPIIVVDPEDEYFEVAERLKKKGFETKVIRLGEGDYLNIFDRPFKDMDYREWMYRTVIPAILFGIGVSERQAGLMTVALAEAIKKAYESKGFQPYNPRTWNREEPTLEDVVSNLKSANIEKKVDHLRKSRESLRARLSKWVDVASSPFAKPSSVHLSELLKYDYVVIVTKRLPDDAKDVVNYYLLMFFEKLMESLKANITFKLRLMLVFDEGWILLKKKGSQQIAPIEPLIRRARKYGFGVVIATQRIEDVSESVLPLVGTTVILQVTEGEKLEKVARALTIPKRVIAQILRFGTGMAMFKMLWRNMSVANASSPIIVRVESAFGKRVGLELEELESEEYVRKVLTSLPTMPIE